MSCEFSSKTRELWFWQRECLVCGNNRVLELHHILGRVSSRPLNSILICHNCHSDGKITNREVRIKYLMITKRFLLTTGYNVKAIDKKFIEYAEKMLNFSY